MTSDNELDSGASQVRSPVLLTPFVNYRSGIVRPQVKWA